MRTVYWARMQLAKQQVTDALRGVAGELIVVETLQDLLAALPGTEALVLYDAPADQAKQVVEAISAPGSTVRWMHFLTAGREGFEAAGLPTHIPVTYPAGAVSPTVAEHAVTLLAALARNIAGMLDSQARREWTREAAARATSLEGKTLAIVGYGQIGREVARRARGFGMHIVGISRSVKSDEFLDEGRVLDDLPDVLAQADAIVIAMSLTADTHHLFDRAMLEKCKTGALLVNVARGGLIDQDALKDALISGKIAAAGLDTVDPEPLPAADPLWDAPNLIVSPHFAGGASPASQHRLAEGAVSNLRRLMKGEELHHVVS